MPEPRPNPPSARAFFVRAADLFADADLTQIAHATRIDDYPNGLGRVIGEAHGGNWMYTGALENYPDLIDRWAQIRPLLGNRGAALRAARDPQQVASVLPRHGLLVPATSLSPDTVPTDGSWLVKPLSSAGGMGIRPRLGSPEADLPGCYYQQFISGEPYSGVYVGNGANSVLIGLTEQLVGRRWGGATDFRYCGSIGPAAVGHDIRRQFESIGQVLAAGFGLQGLFGVDAIVNADGVWVVEINPRYTASVEILEKSLGLRVIELHLAACEHGALPEPGGTANELWGKLIVFAGQRINWSPRCMEHCGEPTPFGTSSLADIPQPGTVIEPGWPVATILACGATRAVVSERLVSQSERLLASCYASQ